MIDESVLTDTRAVPSTPKGLERSVPPHGSASSGLERGFDPVEREDDAADLVPLGRLLRARHLHRNAAEVVDELAALHRFPRGEAVHEVEHEADDGAGPSVAAPAVEVDHLAVVRSLCVLRSRTGGRKGPPARPSSSAGAVAWSNTRRTGLAKTCDAFGEMSGLGDWLVASSTDVWY